MHWLIIFFTGLLLLLAPAPVRAQAESEQLFNTALQSFQGAWYERAEKEFADWIEKFPDAERLPEAVLIQAEARYHLNKYDGVIDLLTERLPGSGPLASQYRYQIARAHLQKGEFETAAAAYESLIAGFPDSPHRLEAIYGQAFARFSLGDVTGAIEILNDPEGPFQKITQPSANMVLVYRGNLLLGQAFHTLRDYRAAEATLKQLESRKPGAKIEWETQNLLVRIELATDRLEAALKRASDLVALAEKAGEPMLTAQALRLKAEILERRDRSAALGVYEQITAIKDLPPEELRKTLLKMVDLTTTEAQIAQAIARLEMFVQQHPQDVALDLLILTLGELHLKKYQQGTRQAGREEPLSLIRAAHAQFDIIINTLTNSSYLGKAYLNRGWCLWEEGLVSADPAKFVAGQAAFRTAAERLSRSEDQATARFKWADCQFQQDDFAGAIENYRLVLEQYADVPRVRSELLERTLHQIVRAALELKNLEMAREAVQQLLDWFPEGNLGDRTLLLYGQELMARGKPAEAREQFNLVVTRFPQSTLLPETKLAIARTHVRQANWPEAIQFYDRWIDRFTNHVARAQTEFDRAWVNYRAGKEARALELFSNFVEQRPSHPLAPQGQYWVADYYYRQGNFSQAELHYQSKIFSRSSSPAAVELAYQARLMAGHAAFHRQSYRDAREYLSRLIDDPQCPPSVLPEAYLLLGETFVKDEPNALENFEKALNAFNWIHVRYPDHALAPVAWGRIGDCNLQLATQEPKRYLDAAQAYRMVLESPRATASARSQAEVGLGRVLELQAPLQPSELRDQFLARALDHYLNVVYGKCLRPDQGDQPDPFWVKEAALAAGRLAPPKQAFLLYSQLIESLPVMRHTWERKLDQLPQTRAVRAR